MDDVGNAAAPAGDDRKAGRLRFEKRHAPGLLHRRPDKEVGLGIAGAERFRIEDPGEGDAGAEGREGSPDFRLGGAATDDLQSPVARKHGERFRQDEIGLALLVLAHHRRGQHPKRADARRGAADGQRAASMKGAIGT